MYIKNTNKIVEMIAKMGAYDAITQDVFQNIIRYLYGSCHLILDDLEWYNSEAQHFVETAKSEGKSLDLDTAKALVFAEFVMEGESFMIENSDAMVKDDLEKQVKLLKSEEYYSNPFIKNLKFDKASNDAIRIEICQLKPMTMIARDTLIHTKNKITIPRIGFFEEAINYPVSVNTKDQALSAITPREISAYQKVIDKAHGKVLNLGLGIGYFAYMASLKDDVEKITIVEPNQDLIELFKEHILPQFEHREKIELVNANYKEYLEELKDKTFDFCNNDITEYGTKLDLYLEIKKLCHKFKKMEVAFSFEDETGLFLFTYLFPALIHEARRTIDNVDSLAMTEVVDEDSTLINALKLAYKKVKITTPDEFAHYMNYKTLLKMLQSLVISLKPTLNQR